MCMYSILLSIDRRQSFQDAIDTVELASQYRDKSPPQCSIVGVDLSGDPSVRVLKPVMMYTVMALS